MIKSKFLICHQNKPTSLLGLLLSFGKDVKPLTALLSNNMSNKEMNN